MTTSGPRAEHRFWEAVGASFPSLKGAASTRYYLACEQALFAAFVPELQGLRIFKTDLWDEAKNTEILRWVAEQGARPVGADLSLEIVREARRVLAAHRPGLAQADIRTLPLRTGSVDLVYSMGTIEHFPEHAAATREIARVLRPGGRAIIGVPNRRDPFLRPLLVRLLQGLGLYAYGAERSFTRRQLARLVEAAGLRVAAESGILFMPGGLRMLDLLWHTRGWPGSRLVGGLVRPFAWLYDRVPALRRHGYLIVCIADKPGG